ncbi:sodium:proton antiporter [Jeotgalibacillus soli]|uniref:Sodium:proton antiporter n=2 Tax=Jeotgalibacillus soli TaxID=889306 RepID=A0A0C2RVR3_9BACL|nr:sodium:proton antiporter [Jeotgalibacillus soli]
MIVFKTVPHIPIIVGIMLLIVYGICRKVSLKELEEGLSMGVSSGIGAVFIFFFIGMIISAFMIAGTIPTLMHIGLAMGEWPFFFSAVFLVTALIGLSIGSSLTTAATLGVVFIALASALDLSLAITAGAVVSGAFFGDKMSPLSDTTNLASSIVQVDLFEHIRNMAWTTIPAFVFSFMGFAWLSPSERLENTRGQIEPLREALVGTGLIHWYALLPILLLFIFAIKRVPALISLASTTIFSIGLSFFHTRTSFGDLSSILFSGYQSSTGVEAIDSLLSRGGLTSMMFTVSLVFLALGLGGLLFTLGIIASILNMLEKMVKKTSSVLITAAASAIGINVLIGEQYLSILLTGEAYKESVDRLNLTRKNLSRVLEDAGTVVNPLVPWGVSGVFLTTVLGVPTLEYLPFALFCLFSPILTILFSITGWTISYNNK